MIFAVVEIGGKQYKVSPGDKLKVEKLEAQDGESVVFDKVLLKSNEGEVSIGSPYINGATVEAKVLKQGRHKKVIVFKYHSKTRYRKKKGHRQFFTELEILKVN